jgi:hypothetical protein
VDPEAGPAAVRAADRLEPRRELGVADALTPRDRRRNEARRVSAAAPAARAVVPALGGRDLPLPAARGRRVACAKRALLGVAGGVVASLEQRRVGSK